MCGPAGSREPGIWRFPQLVRRCRMVAPEDIDVAGHVHVDAGRLWAGGVAAAVVAALVVLAGVLITRGVLGIPVLAPKAANNFGNSAPAVYALLAAAPRSWPPHCCMC